jgi:hypothetical protein
VIQSTIVSPAAPAPERGTAFRRRATGLAFIGAAAVTLAGILTTPFEGKAGEAVYLQTLAAHPRQAVVAATLLHFGYLLNASAVDRLDHSRGEPGDQHDGGKGAALVSHRTSRRRPGRAYSTVGCLRDELRRSMSPTTDPDSQD